MTEDSGGMRNTPRSSRAVLAGVLAIAVHVGLLLFLIFGVHWQNRRAEPVAVELVPPMARAPEAAREPPPKPKESPPPPPKEPPPPPPQREPPPVAKPAPPPKPLPAVKEPPKPDIALKARLERERLEREKLERERVEREKLERQRIERDRAEKQKREQEKLAQEKRERDLRDLAKVEAQRRDRELKDAARREADLRNLEELKLAQARAQQEAEERQRREAQVAREREIRRQQEERAAAASRATADYIARIEAKIRGNVILPPEISGNPEAVFDVVQLPTGEVMSAEIRKSSGSRAYDDAVLRAILKSSPLPKPGSPDLFQRNLVLKFRPRE